MDKLFEQAGTLIREAELLKNGRNVHKFDNAIASVNGCIVLLKDQRYIKLHSEDIELFKTAISRLREIILDESRIQWKFGSG
jgi:hypothetical protein